MQAYDKITARIIAALERGTAPWRKTWSTVGGLPRNLTSGKEYRGVNAFLLALTDFEQPLWLTFKQCQAWGGHVRKGEHGESIVYWNWIDRVDTETGEEDRVPFLKQYTVFNVAQCELDSRLIPILAAQNVREFQPIEACEHVIEGMPMRPQIVEGASSAFYRPDSDSVHMPSRGRFESDQSFYGTLFHELAHSTGHSTRLNREGITETAPFGSPVYSREELVAELAAAFLCGHTGIDCPALDANCEAYLAGWIGVLRGDSKLIVQAAAQAQRAADFIIGTKFEERTEE